ncbi:hypothetical protein QN239_02075 [Mycolicibacterium sp. Y3]
MFDFEDDVSDVKFAPSDNGMKKGLGFSFGGGDDGRYEFIASSVRAGFVGAGHKLVYAPVDCKGPTDSRRLGC